jgi:hypothetical protein
VDSSLSIQTNRKPVEPGFVSAVAGTEGGQYEKFQALQALLDETPRRLHRFSEIDRHIQAVEDAIFALDQNELVVEMFLGGLSLHLRALQQIAYGQWETELERRFVQQLGPQGSIDEYRLAQRFRRLLEREVELLEGERPKRALFIGSGPMPISAILLHEYLGVPVDCVDVDAHSVAQSQQLLERLSLRGRLNVAVTDGASVDASVYDVVLIALLAKPKSEILAQLRRSARPGCRVLCRTSLGLRTLIYEPTNLATDLESYRVVGQRRALHRGDTISTLSLVPKA